MIIRLAQFVTVTVTSSGFVYRCSRLRRIRIVVDRVVHYGVFVDCDGTVVPSRCIQLVGSGASDVSMSAGVDVT